MPLTYTQRIFSGSTNGRNVEVNTTSSPGTTIHTCGATATDHREEIHLYALNNAGADRALTVEFGGTGTEDQVQFTVPSQNGAYLVIPGWPLTATSSIVRAFATATGSVGINGFLLRAT